MVMVVFMNEKQVEDIISDLQDKIAKLENQLKKHLVEENAHDPNKIRFLKRPIQKGIITKY